MLAVTAACPRILALRVPSGRSLHIDDVDPAVLDAIQTGQQIQVGAGSVSWAGRCRSSDAAIPDARSHPRGSIPRGPSSRGPCRCQPGACSPPCTRTRCCRSPERSSR